jgi:uncharacterized protein involved in propanediol utilization
MARTGSSNRHDDKSKASGSAFKRFRPVGVGHAIAHHGELLQGVFEGQDGRLHRGLLTLPLPSQRSHATIWPCREAGIRTRPANRTKAARAVAFTLEHLGIADGGGDLTLESTIAIGHGYGSSTADVVAAIRATACASGVGLRRSTTCTLAVAAEGATDAIVYGDQAVLFAQREGFIIEHFGDEFPPLLIVGFKDPDANPIDTLSLQRARYDAEEIELFRVLRALACRSIRQQDPRLLGRVATLSSRISQRHLPKPRWQAALELAQDSHSCGIQVAHSGTLLGILLDAAAPGASTHAANLVGLVRQAGFEDVQSFALNAEGMMVE